MLIIMSPWSTEKHAEAVCERLETMKCQPIRLVQGSKIVISTEDSAVPAGGAAPEDWPGVERVVPVSPPYRLASRECQPENTRVTLPLPPVMGTLAEELPQKRPGTSAGKPAGKNAGSGTKTVKGRKPATSVIFGDRALPVIAGPCAIEEEERTLASARFLKELGCTLFRGGVFKPRTSPYSFQGLGDKGLEILRRVRAETGLLIVTELLDVRDFDKLESVADIIQIGSRNMANYPLLTFLGKAGKPVLLKRGMSAPLREFLLSAEYLLAQGNSQVILCERGIRTFENETRFTLDINVIPALKHLSHLPIIVDPSHAAGNWRYVEAAALAAIAAGADGLMIEVHPAPAEALSDGSQSLLPEKMQALMKKARSMARAVGRTLG
jgi:3-deoxy-7-phosphoheptulonate synthase